MDPGAALACAHWAGTTADYAFFLDGFLAAFFFVFFFSTATFALAATFLVAAFFAFGRLRRAARWAAANAALAHPVRSSGSSYSRSGNCQYELTVTVLARV